jgi:iron complex outermembrane receptor protein
VKNHLLQSAAFVALGYAATQTVLGLALAQPAWAADVTSPNAALMIEQPQADDQKPSAQTAPASMPSASTILTRPAVVAQAAPPPAASASTLVGQPIIVAQAGAAVPAPQVAQAMTQGEPEEVYVTATRRETLLQETPIAIGVVNTDDLEKRHVESLIDLAGGALPYLRVATFEARQSALTVGIRGIVPFDANQTARDQGVGIYLDGVYLGRQQGLNTALLDVERIEVLRGPQGTLFGRNTEGGAVSIVTKAPSGVFDGRVTGGVGNFGSYNGEVHLNLPAYANVAVKVDGIIQHQNATISNPLAGQYGWNYFNRYGGRVAARWTPLSNFTADFAADAGVDYNTPFYSQLVNYNPLHKTIGVYDLTTNRLVAPGSPAGAPTCAACIAPLSPLVQVHTDRQSEAEIGVPQQLSLDKTSGFTSTLSYELSDALTLRSITSWRGVSTDQWDNSGGAHRTIFAPNANFSRYSLSMLQQHQFSEEFQAVGSIPQLDYVVAFYYFTEHASEKAATPSSNRWNVDGTGYTINSEVAIPPITSGNQGWDPASWFVQRNSRAKAESYSVFGQATYTPAFFDQLHLTAGVRWTHDDRNGILFTVVNKPTNFPFDFSNSRVDPLVTLAYDATPDINFYATYSTGFRAGGANDRSQTFASFGPEEVKSYEIGAKTDLFNRRVRLNVAGYLMDRTGTQTDFDNVDTNPSSPTFNLHTEETRNAPGTSRIQGVEADLTVRITDELTLSGAYAYTDFNVPPTPNPFLGNVLFPVYVVFTPRHAVSGAVDYELPLGSGDMSARFHLDVAYAGSTYSFQAENVKTDSSFIVNGRISLADIPVGSSGQTVTVSVWARNLFDETHIYRRSGANDAVLGDYANFNPPRTFGLEGTVRF